MREAAGLLVCDLVASPRAQFRPTLRPSWVVPSGPPLSLSEAHGDHLSHYPERCGLGVAAPQVKPDRSVDTI